MKKGLSTVLCVIAAVVFVVAAVGIGAVRGWAGERDNALNSLSTNSALSDQLTNRAMDAANLLVVAQRHLSKEDANLTALRTNRAILEDTSATAEELAHADAALSDAAAALGRALPLLDTVKASARDQVYIGTLTRSLSERTDIAGEYAAVVSDFNDRLDRSLTGKLAMLLGVKPLSVD